MHTKVQKWGNSLALRIPKAFADDANLGNNSPVDLSYSDGQIIIKPLENQEWNLDELLLEVNESNIHKEIDTGSPIGNEIW
jgi:antitoxin MazE